MHHSCLARSKAEMSLVYFRSIVTIYSLDSRAVLGNTSLRFPIQPELASSMWKTKGLYFLVRHEQPVSK